VAATPAGAALTTAYRGQQLAAQAGSLRQLIVLWRAVDVTNLSDTIDVFAHAAALLGGQGFDASAISAVRYVAEFRQAEIGATIAVQQARRPSQAYIAGQIRGAALSGIIDARRAGKSVDFAGRNGLVKAVGTFGRIVLGGGRKTIEQAVAADRRALGWMRATSGSPCTFCRMLASRGATYKTERSADFKPHDHCSCTPEPLYEETDVTRGAAARGEEFSQEYQRAQAWARANGTMSQGTSNNALNNYRRWLAAGSPESGGE
jgi:hypothetical protein